MSYIYDILRIPPVPSKNRAETYSFSAFPSARYYNSDLSIWLSVDPLVDKYPNFSPYTYCANNPVKFFDEDGRWSKSVHHKIIKTAVNQLKAEGLLSDEQAKSLIKGMCKGSNKADSFFNGNQSVKKSYIHYMRDPDVSVETAKKDACNYVNTNINKYKETGNFEYLGQAAHTMMDAVCPSHVDENGNPRTNDLPSPIVFALDIIAEGRLGARDKMSCHIAGDKNPTKQQMTKAVENVKNIIMEGMEIKPNSNQQKGKGVGLIDP